MYTLVELLRSRATQSSQTVTFLDNDGHIESVLPYAELYSTALGLAHALHSTGLRPGDNNVVITNFSDARHHILAFWACCIAGIPLCPLPAPHPDPTRQTSLLDHLQSLFPNPVMLTDAEGLSHTQKLVPSLNAILFDDLQSTSQEGDDSLTQPHIAQASDLVALMLTSGSTGKPKAVALRHSNFLSSCQGKSKHHQTTSDFRFFNWIAFDHVASLSEIHIHALLVDASQYHISPAAVARQPRRLLAWCSEFRIAYTFSPNFLLAQIIQDTQKMPFDPSVKLESLVTIISGGESVPVKTAVAFADLLEQLGARRDVLRAGFGMTETAAGSIYDCNPIAQDTASSDIQFLSLGTCCDGISMRIVDDAGVSLPSGEPGALQVHGETVFNKYFNNPSATSASFTKDGWFITGDIGILDSEGRLHLAGREKDVLNVNGVKTSTAEIETYIYEANIPGVIVGLVFACPMRLKDAETETYAIFYQHGTVSVSATTVNEDLATIRATNASIRAACTFLCSQSPHVVLPLPADYFVKTSLGKVSRPQLVNTYCNGKYSFIEIQLAALASAEANVIGLETEVERVVRDCVVDVFNLQISVEPSINLFDLGASSMHLMRVKHHLQERLRLPNLPTIELLRRPVIGDLCRYLEGIRGAALDDRKFEYQPVVCLNSSGSKPPIFLVHPGVGEVLVFINLARVLADGRPVYAIRARGFDHGDSPFETLDETVLTYTNAIEATYPSGPYFVAGYSYGGAIAFEIGKLLESRGKTVQWLGIMNLPPHIQFRMKELIWGEVLLNICMFLSLIPSDSLTDHRQAMLVAFPSLKNSDAEPSEAADIIQWMFARCDVARLVELDLDFGAFLRWVKVAYEINRTGRDFEPRGAVSGALTSIFCAIPLPSMGTREEFKNNRLSAWKDFSGAAFEMVDVDGEHYTMLSEVHVDSFADRMRRALRRAEALPPSYSNSENSLVVPTKNVILSGSSETIVVSTTPSEETAQSLRLENSSPLAEKIVVGQNSPASVSTKVPRKRNLVSWMKARLRLASRRF